jgi:hypothetical protein
LYYVLWSYVILITELLTVLTQQVFFFILTHNPRPSIVIQFHVTKHSYFKNSQTAFCLVPRRIFRSVHRGATLNCFIIHTNRYTYVRTCTHTRGRARFSVWMQEVCMGFTKLNSEKLIQENNRRFSSLDKFSPLNAELNPICHLLALLVSHHILHVGRIRINLRMWWDHYVL